MKWTAQQQQVIADRGRNILVAAAAGSGKTAVLTERIISLLIDGHSLEDFLIITFTKASAKDMKEKIRRAIQHQPRLRREEKRLATAQISTIDSFCNAIVRDNFFYLNIDPAFRIGNQNELAILQDDELNDLFEEHYQTGDNSFLDLVEVFGSDRSDWGLRETVLQLDTYLNNRVDRDQAITEILDGFTDMNYWRDKLDQFIDQYHDEIDALLDQAEDLCFNEKTRQTIISDQATIQQSELVFTRYPVLSKAEKEDPLLVEANINLKKIRDRYIKMAREFEKNLRAEGDFTDMMSNYQTQQSRMDALIQLTEEFNKRFFQKRKEMNMLSFSDVEHLALRAVQNPEIAQGYRERFNYIFIDEYQDTNPIQEGLIECIKRPDNVFMVGDIKQSIYRFRQADPTIFLKKFHDYSQPDQQSVRIDLNRNFRSAKPIIEGVNRIFQAIMLPDYGGIAYDEKSALEFGNVDLSHLEDDVEIMLTEAQTVEREQAEIDNMIRRIQLLHQEGYRYRDMVILMRAPSAMADTAIKQFKEAGLPLMLDYSSAYLKSLEVEILINYLRLIDNFRQDIPLLSVLRLPRYGLTDQDLLDIRHHVPKAPFHQAVLSQELDKELQHKLAVFLDELETFRRHSRSLTIDALLQEIYYETNYEPFILLMPDGKQRLANVRLLFRLAGEYEQTSFVGLSKFLRYVERIMQVDKDIEAARIIPEDADTVRLMSIHKSKGLQFPVVFVAGLHRRFNERDLAQKVIVSDNRAVMNQVDLTDRTSRQPLFKKLLQLDLRSASRQEEIRLLYVAMTRAEKRLILSTVVPDLEKAFQTAAPHSLNSLRECNNYWSLILGSEVIDAQGHCCPGYRLIDPNDLAVMMPQVVPSSITSSGVVIEPRQLPVRVADSKYSVTRLIQREVVVPRVRQTFDEELIGGIEKGIQFHKAMEWIDFNDIDGSLTLLEEEKILEDFQDRALLERFLQHDLMQEYLLQAGRIKRELPFVYRMDIDGEETLVQGIIDMVLELPQGDVLIDYKTDVSLAYLESYQRQVEYYAEAYQAITRRQVSRKLIWFVRLGRFVEVE